MMSTPDAQPGFDAINPPGSRWENRVVARVRKLDWIDPEAPRAEIKRYPVGHFEIYVGAPFEQAVADQVDHLLGPS